MCQRGAIARALAMGAPVLLMDEPFGALDPVNRTRLQDLLLEVWNSSRPARTIVFVTHDVDEAILLADRVVCSEHVQGESSRTWMSPFPGRVLAGKPTCGPSFRACARPSPTTCRATCCSGCRPRTRWRRPRDMSIGVKRPQVDHPLPLGEGRGEGTALHVESCRGRGYSTLVTFSVRSVEASPSPSTPNPSPEGEG